MRLHAWKTVWRDVEFDPRSGSASTIKLSSPRPDTSAPIGFAHYERSLFGPRQVFALFKVGDALFFSAGARRWQLDQAGLQFVHTHPFPFLSRFRVVESGQAAFSITYSHVGRLLFALLDPTYDKIDEDTDFFLAFVAEYAQSAEWQANARQRWVSAPAV
jgi:hypothetical protein